MAPTNRNYLQPLSGRMMGPYAVDDATRNALAQAMMADARRMQQSPIQMTPVGQPMWHGRPAALAPPMTPPQTLTSNLPSPVCMLSHRPPHNRLLPQLVLLGRDQHQIRVVRRLLLGSTLD